MAIRKIVTEGDPVLNKVCHPVTNFDQKLADLLDDMRETLTQASGAGLAAPQVGILRRVALVVVNEDGEMLELVNPEIVEQKGEQDGLEGCLSVPGKWAFIKRPDWVKIRAQDRSGNWFEAEGREIVARCFCHELAHLDGHLYTELADRIYTTEELDELMAEQEDDE
ncbi:MAG: peptide deformylase [Clostridium sp.]|nr:peptide deformylase [Clostridium sp.]